MRVMQSRHFHRWLARLRDPVAKGRLVSAIHRLSEGLTVDTKWVGAEMRELRLHHGPGYRVYFYRRGDTLILLLCGGHKGSQQRDIARAERILRDWRCEND